MFCWFKTKIMLKLSIWLRCLWKAKNRPIIGKIGDPTFDPSFQKIAAFSEKWVFSVIVFGVSAEEDTCDNACCPIFTSANHIRILIRPQVSPLALKLKTYRPRSAISISLQHHFDNFYHNPHACTHIRTRARAYNQWNRYKSTDLGSTSFILAVLDNFKF